MPKVVKPEVPGKMQQMKLWCDEHHVLVNTVAAAVGAVAAILAAIAAVVALL